MKTIRLLLPLLCFAACAPESVQVLTPRASSPPPPAADAGSNHAEEADQRLREATEEAIHIEDILEEPVHMQGEDEPVHFQVGPDQ